MTTDPDVPPMTDPERQLEKTLIDDFIRMRGHEPGALERLTPADRKALLIDASIYAAGRLAEVEARAHLVREVHHAREDDGAGRLP